MNLSMEYCHSGLQTSPSCGLGSAHEGDTNQEQLVQIWSYNSSTWENLTNLFVNETHDVEQIQIWNISYPATDYVKNNIINYRIE